MHASTRTGISGSPRHRMTFSHSAEKVGPLPRPSRNLTSAKLWATQHALALRAEGGRWWLFDKTPSGGVGVSPAEPLRPSPARAPEEAVGILEARHDVLQDHGLDAALVCLLLPQHSRQRPHRQQRPVHPPRLRLRRARPRRGEFPEDACHVAQDHPQVRLGALLRHLDLRTSPGVTRSCLETASASFTGSYATEGDAQLRDGIGKHHGSHAA